MGYQDNKGGYVHAPIAGQYVSSPAGEAEVTVPGAPTNAVAVAGDTEADVSWDAPASTGGSAITSYTVTSSPGGLTETTPDGDTLTATVTGLTNGVEYTFTVVATNAVGDSAASDASNAVTPEAAGDLLLDLMVSAVAAGMYSITDQASAAYTGPLFRVRNGTTTTETDIDPLGDGTVDLVTLDAACRVAGSFVECTLVTVYDQSGNGYNLTQATVTKQPLIATVADGLLVAGTQGLLAAAWTAAYNNTNDRSLARADALGLSGDVAFAVDTLARTTVPALPHTLWMLGRGATGGQAVGVVVLSDDSIEIESQAVGNRTYDQTGAYVAPSTYQHMSTERAAGGDLDVMPFSVNGSALTTSDATSGVLSVENQGFAWGGSPDNSFGTYAGSFRASTLIVWSTPPAGADRTAVDAWMAARI